MSRPALLLLPLLLLGCPDPQPNPTDPVRQDPIEVRTEQPQEVREVGLELPSLAELERLEGSSVGGARRALLIVADDYAAQPSWQLGQAQAALDALRGGLEAAGFAREDQVLVRGPEATRAGIQRAVTELGRATGGPGNVWWVYYYGHGHTRADRELELFTFDTDRQDPDYTHTISYGELGGWLAEGRRDLEDRGGSARVVTVVDACRVANAAPPGRAVAREIADVEVFSAQEGQWAAESVFTRQLADALLRTRGRDDANLEQVVRLAAEGTRDATGRIQQPEVRGEAEGVRLGAESLRVEFEVVDQLFPTQTLSARVTLNGEAGPAGAFDDVRPGRYFLQVEAEGYLWRSEEVNLLQGGRYRVGLLPAVAVIRGRVENPRGTRVSVQLAGTRPDGWVEGYHAEEVGVQGQGAFVLKVPQLDPQGAVRFVIGGEEVAERRVEEGIRGYVEVEGARIPVVELGLVEAAAAGLAGVETAVPEVVVAEVNFPEGLRFVDAGAEAQYERAKVQILRGAWERAWRGLLPLADGGAAKATADEASRVAVDGVLQQVLLKWIASTRDVVRLGASLRGEELTGEWAEDGRRLWVRWLDEDAQAAERGGELTRAIALWTEAGEATADASVAELLAEKVERTWLRAVREGVARALEDDTWDTAAEGLGQAQERYPASETLIELSTWLERERQPRWARERVEEGHAAYGRGDLEVAERLYRQARPACNPHYAEVVDAQLADLEARLYAKYYNRADDLLARGEEEGALESYFVAYQYRPEWVAPSLEPFRGRSDFAEVAARVDRRPPEITVLSPTGAAWARGNVEFVVQVEDLVDRVTLEIGTGSWEVPAGQRVSRTLTLREGTHDVEVLARDSAGNEGRATVRVRVDRTAPQVTLLSPSDGDEVEGRCDVRLRVDDAADATTVQIDGQTWELSTGEVHTITAPTRSTGAQTVTVRAVDPAGNRGEASVDVVLRVRALVLGHDWSGTLSAGSPIDFVVTVDEPCTAQFDTQGSAFDTVLELYDTGGTELARDDDGGDGTTSLMQVDLQPGTYSLRVRGYSDTHSGALQLHSRLLQGSALRLGETVRGTIAADEAATYTLFVDQTVDVTLLTEGSSFDTVLVLLDANRQQLARDDDGGEGNSSRIARALEPGTYYVEVRGYSNQHSGAFVLAASTAAPTPTPTPTVSSSSSLTDTGATRGTVAANGEEWIDFYATSGREYVLTTAGSNFDTILELYDVSGASLASDDDSGPSTTSMISTFLSEGSYRIKLRGYSGAAGDYQLLARPLLGSFGSGSGTNGTLEAGTEGWFLLTVSSSNRISVTTAGSDFDTVLTVYSLDGTELGTNDDADGTTASRVDFDAAAESYLIQLRGYSNAGGTFSLRVP